MRNHGEGVEKDSSMRTNPNLTHMPEIPGVRSRNNWTPIQKGRVNHSWFARLVVFGRSRGVGQEFTGTDRVKTA